MALLTAIGIACLCYAAVLLEDFSENKWRLLIKVVCWFGSASLISFVAFGGYWLAYRTELNRRREECRQLIMNLLESRLGKVHAMPTPAILKEPDNVVVEGAAKIAKLSTAHKDA